MSREQIYIAKLKPYFQDDELVLLDKVIDYARYLYESLYRHSGESYMQRALRLTAEKIVRLQPDQQTIVASILSSAYYSPRYDKHRVRDLFGDEVATMVESLGKINSIKARYSDTDHAIIRRMLLAIAYDIRVILIRLMDRIDSLETLEFMDEEKQKHSAREILEVYVPIASQLGLYEISLQLEDLAFRHVFAQDYENLKKDLEEYLSKTKSSMEEVKKDLEEMLKKEGFDVRVNGRIKNMYSIYKKLKKKTRPLDQIYDIYAMRIILNSKKGEIDSRDDIQKLYAILSFLHSKYEYLSDRFKDYVANPKVNGYQSLHTAVIGLNSKDPTKPTEIQIRTEKMHQLSEFGKAAHWMYKGHDAREAEGSYVDILKDLRNNVATEDSRTASLKMDLYPDRVFVMTPDNLIKDLPKGATPVDFAYSLSSITGHTCYLAKINGTTRPLNYVLQNGDVVEILTDSKLSPKLSWLSFVVTKHAKNRIKNYFRELDEEDLVDQGKAELNELLKEVNFPLLDADNSFLGTYKRRRTVPKERARLLEEIGSGDITAREIFRDAYGESFEDVKRELIARRKKDELKDILPTRSNVHNDDSSNNLLIGGERHIPYKLATCCKPKITDDVVAFTTKGATVSVHRVSCKMVKKADPARLLEVRINDGTDGENEITKYEIGLVLEVKERPGFVRDLVNLMNEQKIVIQDFAHIRRELDSVFKRLVIQIYDNAELERTLDQLGMLAGVLKIARV